MQPNNNFSAGAPSNVPQTAPQTTPINPDNGVVFKDKPKKNHAVLFGMIFLAILAAGGIGFGVWAMLSKNQVATELNNQISDLQNQLSDLSDQLSEKDERISELESSIEEQNNSEEVEVVEGQTETNSTNNADTTEETIDIETQGD